MPQFRASWVVPISQPPIKQGWIRIDGGRIVAFGRNRRGGRELSDEIDLGSVAILPGLVNAHTHLELSWMRGRIQPTDDFPGWIRDVIRHQRAGDERGPAAMQSAIAEAIAEARRTGTVLFGDISNTLASVPKLIESRSAAVVFREVIGFPSARAAQVAEEAVAAIGSLPSSDLIRYALAAHAPYSVSPKLFQKIRNGLERDPFARCSVHLGESTAETQFVQEGSGPWRALLEEIGAWDPSWQVPECSPVEYLDRLGFIGDRLLVVHGVYFGSEDLRRLKARGATLVTCPRGNVSTGAGVPPIETFYQSGVRVAIGTDSLASVPDLNMFSELAELRRRAPKVPATALLESATINGARALGFESRFGTIEAGKLDHLIAVDLPESATNAEEELVSGICEEQIHRIST